ncbi:MAG TPA: cache domain-containing protein, partial [Thermoanaerobaculia bacterium]|nr:cache domain-containing protein [Thermoanaerobaculia bacterium]
MTLVPDDSKPQPPGLFDRARLPVAFLLVCVFVLGGYYFLHVESKSSYLMGRNFRLLATMGGGIKMSLESYGQVFGSYARDLKGSHGHLPQEFFNCGRHQEVPKNAVHPDGEPLIFLAEQPIDHLVFAHFAEPVVSEHAVLSCDLSLQTLLAPLFDSKEAFDVVLLVEPDGDVVYQHGGPELGVTRLPLDSGQPAQKAGAKAAVVPSLLSSSVDRNVVLGGREYKLFAEPLRLPIANPEGSVTPWFLCGLVAADKFVSKSLAVSSSLLLSILAALLLLALSWPLIKLRLLGERQRVRLLDVLLLGGCSLLGVAILTLSLLDFYAYREFESTAAGQLHDFALKMAANVETEISAARRDLALLEARAASLSAAQEDASRGSGMSSRVPLSITPSRDWINFSLIDREGMQQVKWTPPDGPLLPKVYVRDRSYFQHALSGETGTRPAAAGGFVEAVMAWTSRSRFRRSREAVLAVPVSNPSLLDQGFAVATLAMPMHSVIGPLTPPGFEFAVIDDQGEVLFHANPSRNGVENFFAETDGDPHLRSAVFARHAEEMEVHYFGEDYMAAVQPVAGLPWTVVALRSKE